MQQRRQTKTGGGKMLICLFGEVKTFEQKMLIAHADLKVSGGKMLIRKC